METLFPDTDFSCETPVGVPWRKLALKTGYMHDRHLHMFWNHRVKYYDEAGKLRLKMPVKPPIQVLILCCIL